MVKERNESVDALKGLLIFTVVLGHVLLGSLDENPIRYLIYSFHMPAFFFISGYLLNIDKLKGSSYRNICIKYWHRMLKSWFIAWCIYTIYTCTNNISLHSIAHQVYSPYYHLWFVPSLFLSILLTALVFHKMQSEFISITILLLFGILTFNINASDYKIKSFFSCHMTFFLILGMLARRLPSIQGGEIVITALTLVILTMDNFINMKFETYRTYFQLPLSMCLCVFGFVPILQKRQWKSRLLQFWGRYSLEIYLWHVLPILVLKKLINNNDILYYASSFTLMGVLTGISIFIERKQLCKQ